MEDNAQELLNQLVGMLKPTDLEDPAIALALEKVVNMVENKQEIPHDMATELMEIEDKAERFRMAAKSLGIKDEKGLEALAQQMIQQDLLKSEDLPIKA